MKYVAPSIHETAFNCPHCGTFTTQTWYSAHAEPNRRDNKPAAPFIHDSLSAAQVDFSHLEDEKKERELRQLVNKMATGIPFLKYFQKNTDYVVHNVFFASCYNCSEISIWMYDRLIWPKAGEGAEANPDLPPDVRADYDEASTILDLSPRGAAALLRLSIQKLCAHLGGRGENLNEDIGKLVADGLNIKVKQAIDIVRVIGNNAVHPGQIDLKDDRGTADELFRLVNLIAEMTITQKKHLDEMYGRLPEAARAAIEKRDAKK